MDVFSRMDTTKKKIARRALNLTVATGLLLTTSAAFADSGTAMAPPIGTSSVSATGADNVFNWQEVPTNQPVDISRAAFDQGGYQLYDTVGETIVVPFTNQNLYVMKFAPSDNGKMYLVNDGNVPVLYVPQNGYLDNATVGGARWYPFGKEFHPSEPVFLGIAPSWSAFVDMGWYPDMYCYGGYWGHSSFISGGIFLPTIGFFFEIGGHPYYGWDGYHHYYRGHPAPYRIGYYHRDYYRWADRSHGSLHEFGGVNHSYYAHRPFEGVHSYGGGHSFGGGGRVFHGTSEGRISSHTFGGDNRGDHQFGGNHTFHGGIGDNNHQFGGDNRANHQTSGSHTFNGGIGDNNHRSGSDRIYQGSTGSGHGDRSFGGSSDHSFRGASGSGQSDRVTGGSRSSGGGSDHSFRGASRGDSGNSGGHSFGGGSGRSGGGGGDHHNRG